MPPPPTPPGPHDLAVHLIAYCDDRRDAEEAFVHNATFHSSMMALASLLPSMIQGILTASTEADERIRAEIERIEQTPSARLYVMRDDLITPGD